MSWALIQYVILDNNSDYNGGKKTTLPTAVLEVKQNLISTWSKLTNVASYWILLLLFFNQLTNIQNVKTESNNVSACTFMDNI